MSPQATVYQYSILDSEIFIHYSDCEIALKRNDQNENSTTVLAIFLKCYIKSHIYSQTVEVKF